jgi:hypothetical protein
MKFNFPTPRPLIALCFLAYTSTTDAHTWIETMQRVASNGSFVGAVGYPRGFLPRTAPNPDAQTNLIPPNGRATGNTILATDLMCASTQTVGTQSAGFPRLKAAPNDQIALRYEENGHVTKFFVDGGKPLGRGTVFIYGTQDSKNSDTYLNIHRVWNADGTGGDKRGKLLATRPFDDGHCFQNNGEPVAVSRAQKDGTKGNIEVLCQNEVQVPADVGTSGTYTLYWVWEWPTLFSNGNVAKNQSYTSCMDIELTSSAVADAGSFKAQQTGSLINSVAIQAQMETAYLVNPTALPKIAADNTGEVQPNGIKATSAAAENPAQATSKSSSKTATASSSAQGAKGPAVSTSSALLGFVTVTKTINAPVTIEKTVTVTAGAPASSAKSGGSTKQIVSMTTTTSTVTLPSATAASQGPGGVFTSSPAMSSNSPEPSTLATSASSKAAVGSNAQASASIKAVSAASGKYTTNTAVPTPEPFLNSAAKVEAYVPVRRRRHQQPRY